MSQLADALFTTTQKKVLGLFYVQPEKSFYINEILRLTGMGVHTIKRELDRMTAAGIISMTKIGNQHHYQASTECPIYHELLSIAKKTFGAADVIKRALSPITEQIAWAFIFGSVASGKETSASDIDLMIIGNVDFTEVVRLLYPVQKSLGREINPKVYSSEEWMQLQQTNSAFVKEILENSRIDIIGNANEPG